MFEWLGVANVGCSERIGAKGLAVHAKQRPWPRRTPSVPVSRLPDPRSHVANSSILSRSPVFAAAHSSLDAMPRSILVINPNSSESVTSGLRDTLSPPPDTTLTFYTAPSHAPPSINDLTTANLTATACFKDIRAKGLVELYDGFLVCCCTSPSSPSPYSLSLSRDHAITTTPPTLLWSYESDRIALNGPWG